jgi:plastocyanin
MSRLTRSASALLLVLLTLQVTAADHVVSQKGKNFYPRKMSVRVGESVTFVNDDPFAHNVFSLSDTKSFDLGSYGNGHGKSVLMDKAGVVEVECAVHPDMKMVIEVSP